MINSRALCLLSVIACLVGSSLPAIAATYARNYELQTLDHRFAATLVVDLCESLGEKPDSCKVQVMHRGMISVFASPAVHAEVIRLLSVSDERPASLGFRIILVRSGSERDSGDPPSPEIRQALDAIQELLGLSSTVVQDTGVLWTADRGGIRLNGGGGRLYVVNLQLRSLMTRREGRELTVELEVRDAGEEEKAPPLLSSVVTLRVGETVVAGSSRVRSEDEPLLVLLSSLPIDSKTSR